jgi:hypothetical protein
LRFTIAVPLAIVVSVAPAASRGATAHRSRV